MAQNAPKLKMPVRTTTVQLNGDYTGFEATVRTNPPVELWYDLYSEEMDRVLAAYTRLITSWNFVDEEGEPLPLDMSGLRRCPSELLRLVMAEVEAKNEPGKN